MTTLKCPYCVKEFNSKSNLNQHLNKKYKCFSPDNNTQSSLTNTSFVSNEEIEKLKNKLNKTTNLNNTLKNEIVQLKLKLSKIYDIIIEKQAKNVSSNPLISVISNKQIDENDTKTDISQDKTFTTDTLSTITPVGEDEYNYEQIVLPHKWIKHKIKTPMTL